MSTGYSLTSLQDIFCRTRCLCDVDVLKWTFTFTMHSSECNGKTLTTPIEVVIPERSTIVCSNCLHPA